MRDFKFEVFEQISDDEFLEYFDLMKNHLAVLYGEEATSQESFQTWKGNLKNCKNKKLYIKMFCDSQICGYADLLCADGEELYFCNVIIKEEYRRTTLLFEFLKFLLGLRQMACFSEITFHINHRNRASLSTFSHLGYEMVSEGKNSNKFRILRKDAQDYIEKISRRLQK